MEALRFYCVSKYPRKSIMYRKWTSSIHYMLILSFSIWMSFHLFLFIYLFKERHVEPGKITTKKKDVPPCISLSKQCRMSWVYPDIILMKISVGKQHTGPSWGWEYRERRRYGDRPRQGGDKTSGADQGQLRWCNGHIKAEEHRSPEMMSKSEINSGKGEAQEEEWWSRMWKHYYRADWVFNVAKRYC